MPDVPVRVRDACDRCHSKKMRCQRAGAHCKRCQQAGVGCTFSPRTPYNASNRVRNNAHRSRQSSLSSNNTFESQTETSEASISMQMTRDLNGGNIVDTGLPRSDDWNFGNIRLPTVDDADVLNLHTISTASAHQCAPATSTDISDDWMSLVGSHFDLSLPLLPTLFGVPPESMDITGTQEKTFHYNQISSVADVSTEIFRTPAINCTALKDLSVDHPLLHSDFYCQTFASSHSLLRAIAPPDNDSSVPSTGKSGIQVAEANDADILLVLASFLKLLSRYDSIFSCWIPLIEPEMDELFSQVRSNALRDMVLRVLPPANSMDRLFAPICYVAQIRLVLEISHKMYDRVTHSLEAIAEQLTGGTGSGDTASNGHISSTTLELIMGREGMVRAKKTKLLGLMESSRLRENMERHFSMLEGDDKV